MEAVCGWVWIFSGIAHYVLISLGKKLIFITRRTFNPLKRVNSNEKYLVLFSFLFPYQQYVYSGITVLVTWENPRPSSLS